MFKGCTGLKHTPELPATTLSFNCYSNMFSDCTSLTQAPSLPATTLTPKCYYNMFYGCSSLTKAPELPATDLEYGCYQYMFKGCSKLNYIKALFTIADGEFIGSWLSGVSPTGTFIKSKDATWTNDEAGIPTGWTVQTA